MAENSAYTSIHQVPAFFKSDIFRDLVVKHQISGVLDVGGGKYDDSTEFLWKEYNVVNYVYDPYNRSDEYNQLMIDSFTKHALFADYRSGSMITCLNVLNVIQDDQEMEEVIKFCASMKTLTVFQIYEGDRSGIKSTGTVQRNQLTSNYVDVINNHFPKTSVTKNFIICEF